MSKTRLYLDVDGVINAFLADEISQVWPKVNSGVASSNGREYRITWSPDMIQKLKNLDVEIVWLTTWRLEAPKQIGKLVGIGEDARVLHPITGVTTFPSIYWKRIAILEEQKNSPSRYIWAEDEILHSYFEDDANVLLIKTNPYTGISPSDIDLMETFIQGENN